MSQGNKKFEVERLSPGLDDVSVNKEVVSNPNASARPQATTSEGAPEATAETVSANEVPRGSKRLEAEQAAGRDALARKFGSPDANSKKKRK
jgi:hypothetical protein